MARKQSRNDRAHDPPSAEDPDYRDYLECQNASNPIDFIFGTSVADNATDPVLNDQGVTMTATDILNALQGPLAERMQRTVAPLLSEYGDIWITASGGKFLLTPSPSPRRLKPPRDVRAGGDTTEGVLPTAVTTPRRRISTLGPPFSSLGDR